MKIADLDKLVLFSPKIIDGNEGIAFKDPSINNSIFISDTTPLTNLFSDYVGKLRFSKKFNRKLYFNKYVKTPKLTYTRNFVKLRSSLIKGHAILETDPKLADAYDISLENVAFRNQLGFLPSFNKLNAIFEKDSFIHSRTNLNVFWIVTNNLIDPHVTPEQSNIDHFTLSLLRQHKKYFLNPETNKNIKNMFILVPFDMSEDKEIVDLRFYLIKIYQNDKPINYARIHSIIEKSLHDTVKIQKKPLFSLNVKKETADEEKPIDNTYTMVNPDNELIKSKETNNKDAQEVIQNIAKEIEAVKIKTDDKNQLNETTYDQLKQTYMESTFKDEMKDMFEASIKNFLPDIELKKHEIKNADDGITDQDNHIFTIKDINSNKEKEVSILVPRVIDDKFFRIYDKKYILANQVYSNLINKIKDDTVAFTSSHTKTIIYVQGKADDRIGKFLQKQPLKNIPSIHTYSVTENKDVPGSLNSIFKYVTAFQYKDYIISYDLYQAFYIFKNDDNRIHPIKSVIGIRKDLYPSKVILQDNDSIKNYIKDIYTKYGPESILIYNSSIDSINNKPFLLELKNEFSNKDSTVRSMPIPGSNQFARMNIAGKKVPVLISMLIAYQNQNPDGRLESFFDKYFKENVHFDITEKPLNVDNIISIKLKDGYINIFIYESLVGSELLFSILRKIDLSKYSKEDLLENNDINLILISYFESQKYQADVVIRSISMALNSIIDPITKSMIEKSNYEYPLGNETIKPNDLIELLYYCIYLLNDRSFKQGNDFSGYRIRNMETIPALLYKIISDQAASVRKEIDSKTKNRRKSIDAFSIKSTKLMEDFRNLTTFESFSDLNIANEIGLTSKATYKGFAGLNNNRSIAYGLRATDPSSIGFIDMGNNVDNQNVGSNRMMPLNPNFKDIRGSEAKIKNLQDKVMNDAPLTDEETSSLLSFDIYSDPFIAPHADAPRISMSSIQARHGIPLENYDDLPIKTGTEDTIKNIVSSAYVIKAPKESEKYKVKSINEDKKEIVLTDNKNKDSIVSYRDKVVNNSGSGFHILKEFEPCVKVNEVVSKNQPIALDKGSFKNGNYTNAKLLRTTLLNFAETLEDGAIVSESAAKDLVFNYVTEKQILIRKDQTIIKLIDNIGQEIEVGNPLLVFSKTDETEDINSIFGNINKELEDDEGLGLNTYIKSKFPGKIVDIKIQYNGTLRNNKALDKLIKNLPKENVTKIETKRMAGEIAEDGILITYYILTKIPAMSGSKTTSQSTKSVFVVWPDDQMPKTLDGKRIDYVFSTFSIISRINKSSLYRNVYRYKVNCWKPLRV